jgi:mono/diheme cytochrome c family protein
LLELVGREASYSFDDSAVKRLAELPALIAAITTSGLCLLVILGLTTAFGHPLSANQATVDNKAALSEETVARGHKLFFLHCAECHGFNGKGTDDGPDLYDLREGNALIRQVITGGVRREMPAFGKKLNDSDVQALIAYLRTLRNGRG